MIHVGRENDASKAVRQMCSHATLQDVLGGVSRVKVAEGMWTTFGPRRKLFSFGGTFLFVIDRPISIQGLTVSTFTPHYSTDKYVKPLNKM